VLCYVISGPIEGCTIEHNLAENHGKTDDIVSDSVQLLSRSSLRLLASTVCIQLVHPLLETKILFCLFILFHINS